jgi:hypothetical protein
MARWRGASALQRREAEVRRQIERLVDADAAGALDLEELQARKSRLAGRLAEIRWDADALAAASAHDERLAALAQQRETFRATLAAGLETASFARRRELVELLIERVVVDAPDVEIRYILPVMGTGPPKGELRAHDPSDVGRIHVASERRPFLHRLVGDRGMPGRVTGDLAPTPVGEGPGLGGVAQDRQEGGGARRTPKECAGVGTAGLAPREPHAIGAQAAHQLVRAAAGREPLEDDPQDVLDLLIRVLHHLAGGQADQAGRQVLAEGPLGDLAQAPGVEAPMQEVQLRLAEHAAQPQ